MLSRALFPAELPPRPFAAARTRAAVSGVLAFAAVSAFAIPQSARADSVLSALGIDPNSLVSPDVIKSLVTFVGFGAQHRPYEPATPLGLFVGLDLSIELTLFKIPDSFFENLASVGAPASAPLPSLPLPKAHVHKGLGESVDVGASIFFIPSNWIVGADVKIVLSREEEGPTYAFRFCYTRTELNYNGLSISTRTYSPQLLLSRQMEFADPYLGAAFEYATGNVSATITVPASVAGQIPAGVTVPPQVFSPDSVSIFGAYAFGGVSLRIPHSGLRITLEGAYNTAGTSSMGTKVGFTF